jgi:membrane protein implicated in regulation of membrane protease activity
MSGERTDEVLALGVFLLWIGGVCMLLVGIWLPSWQWAATGILSIVLGFVALWLVGEL